MSIDYGMGKTNIDRATGIRYGVLSQDAVLQAWADSSEPDYGVPFCPYCGDELEDWDERLCLACGRELDPEDWDFTGPSCFYCQEDGYEAGTCLDTDIMIYKSPYFTYGEFGSPCVPGAIVLEENAGDFQRKFHNLSLTDGRAYCFGPDWFEDGVAPYPVFRVDTGEPAVP